MTIGSLTENGENPDYLLPLPGYSRLSEVSG
jgi:hypothetical protein